MRTFKTKIAFSFIGVLLTASAFAVPQKYNNCGIQIKEPSNSNGYYWDKDCKHVYVLPPKLGTLNISAFRQTGLADQRCQAIESLEKQSADFHSISEIYMELAAENAKKIQELKEGLDSGLIPIGKTRKDVLNDIKAYVKDSKDMRDQVDEFNKYYVENMKYFASREGGWGSFIISNTHSELIEEFKRLNDEGITFSRLTPDINMLSIVDKVADSETQKSEMSAVLDMTIPGQPLPMSKAVANLLVDEKVQLTEGDLNADIFSGALSGQIRLSDIGACAVDKTLGATSEFPISDLKAYISSNAFFEYQVQVERKYSVTYNLAELFKQMREQTKTGGFFSRKTLHKLIEDRNSDSWIIFHSESNDIRFEYTAEDIKEIKKDFIDRALKQVIGAKAGNTDAALTLLDPSGNNGADSIAGELGKCSNLYCQIGAAGFRVLSSIFGNEKASSELIKSFDGSATETVTSKKTVKQYGSMSFQ